MQPNDIGINLQAVLPETITAVVAFIIMMVDAISRNIERIGDHATNIAEEAIYIVQGRDIRHASTTADKGVA